jgi:hypothetical protein
MNRDWPTVDCPGICTDVRFGEGTEPGIVTWHLWPISLGSGSDNLKQAARGREGPGWAVRVRMFCEAPQGATRGRFMGEGRARGGFMGIHGVQGVHCFFYDVGRFLCYHEILKRGHLLIKRLTRCKVNSNLKFGFHDVFSLKVRKV